MAAPPKKKKRKALSFEDEIKMINAIETDEKKADVTRKCGVAESMLESLGTGTDEEGVKCLKFK